MTCRSTRPENCGGPLNTARAISIWNTKGTDMKYSTGILDAMFGEKMTIQIEQGNGIMKDVVVTKAWWEKTQKGKEGVFKVVKLGSQSVTAHILDPKTGYSQERWIAGTHITLEDMEKLSDNGSVFVLAYDDKGIPQRKMEKLSDNGSVFVLDFNDKGIPQRKVVSRSDWNKAKAHFDQVDGTEAGKQVDPEKLAVLEKLAVQFDQAAAKYLKLLIDGLSDQDAVARRVHARMMADTVVPALMDDTNLETRDRSLKTLNALMVELRPPKNEHEMLDLKNAAFFTVKRLLTKLYHEGA